MVAAHTRVNGVSGTVQMGLAVTSHSAGVLSTATFDQLTLGSATMTPPGSVTTTAPAAPSGVTSYPVQTTYNDGSQPTSLTYSDNEVLSYGYDGPSGWLSSLATTPAGGSATTLLGGIGYTGAGGAAGHATSAQMAGETYAYSASYDADLRLSSLSVAHNGNTLFSSQRGYDAVGNVTAVGTTLAAGTDNQVFCYDDQHRLTWAGSTGTPNCGTSLTPGSLTAANYTQTFAYDTLDRPQSGPLGSYSYGDSAHLHAVTAIGTNYSATYDASGNMTCRAATSSTTCSGTPTGAVLSFDNEGRLSAWQNTPTNPTTTDSFLYDGEGARVEQQTTTNGSIITSTVYVDGGLEEITSNGSTTTLTKYFGAAGLPTAERVGTNGPLSYLATDGQGTVSESLDGSGNVTSAQLYTPYGTVRYSSGSSPTSMGYTGQRADSATGLDYYHARYYDPAAGQFISADTVEDGLNRYGYVAGNPTTNTDPTGHRLWAGGDSGGGGSNTPPDCHVTYTCPPPPPKHTCVTDNNCPTTPQPQPPSNGSGTGGGGKGSNKPLVYDRVLAECGPLAGICASVINALGGANIFANKGDERVIGVILAIAGVVVDFVDAYYTISHAVDKSKGIAIALAALGAITTIIGLLTNLDMPDWIKGTLWAITTIVDAFAGGLEAAAALYLQLGPWGEFVADAAVTTVTTAAEGETAPVMGILGMLGGDAATYILGTMGSALTSVGESLIMDSYA